MIIKGRARGGGAQLAAYLLDKKNEVSRVLEVSGTSAEDLRNSLREMEAVGLNATTSQAVLYHAQIAPARDDEMTQAQYIEAADRLGAALGLAGQPRALVMHSYRGHEHLHVVWSRADAEQHKVISNSWDRRHHHQLCRQLEQEWGLEIVQSGYDTGGHDRSQQARDTEARQHTRLREEAKERGDTHREKDIAQQEIRWCWDNSATGQILAANLKQMGYHLAEGRTGPIAIDEQSGVEYAIARMAGVKREEARQRCAGAMMEAGDVDRRSKEQKAGRNTHLSPRKAKDLVHDQMAAAVANDSGDYEANKRRAMNMQHMTMEEFKARRDADQQRQKAIDDPTLER